MMNVGESVCRICVDACMHVQNVSILIRMCLSFNMCLSFHLVVCLCLCVCVCSMFEEKYWEKTRAFEATWW